MKKRRARTRPRKRPAARTYRDAGVDIAAGERMVGAIQRHLASTDNGGVLENPGGFAGLYRLFANGRRYRDPVLMGCSDGVGSKVLIAAALKRFDTVGIDLVAMSVNDLITTGALPLFFLDYLAVHRLQPAEAVALVSGIARGCRESGCALLGGETAEMPDIYRRGEFDLAGFAVGVCERSAIIDGSRIRPGDRLIGLASSGIHSNGYSLVRKVFAQRTWSRPLPGRRSGTLGQLLLKPTRLYVKPMTALWQARPRAVRGLAHITGGGLAGNVPRMLPNGCQAVVQRKAWRVPAVFQALQATGIPEVEMWTVFNMGIGMVLATPRSAADAVLAHFRNHRVAAREIGHIVKGPRQLTLD